MPWSRLVLPGTSVELGLWLRDCVHVADGGFDGFVAWNLDGFVGYDGVRGFDGYDGGIDGFKPKQRRDNCKR